MRGQSAPLFSAFQSLFKTNKFIGNCETAFHRYESVQNKQMAAQNRFKFASYLFILLVLDMGVSQLSNK